MAPSTEPPADATATTTTKTRTSPKRATPLSPVEQLAFDRYGAVQPTTAKRQHDDERAVTEWNPYASMEKEQ